MARSVSLLSCRSIYLCHIIRRDYAAKAKAANPVIGGLGKKIKGKAEGSSKVKLEVEKDPNRLVNYLCGSNIMQTGEDIKLKPDSEYPDWLWNIHTGPAKKLEDLEPGSKEYLELLKRINIKKALHLRSKSKIKPS